MNLLQYVVRRWLLEYAIVQVLGFVLFVIVIMIMTAWSRMIISSTPRTGNSAVDVDVVDNADRDRDNNYNSLQPHSSLRQRQQKKKTETIKTNKKKNIALRPLELRPNADKWKAMTRDEMSEELKCNYEKDRPITDPDAWIGMREAYISIVGTERATVEVEVAALDDNDNDNNSNNTFETAFRVPFEVRQSPRMGRGIFLAKGLHGNGVKKGEILYDFSQSAQFWDGSEFAEFVRILQPELACDVLMWSYTQYFGEGVLPTSGSYSVNDFELLSSQQKSNLRIMTDLDPGSFCNNGSLEKGNMAWLNSEGNIAEGNIAEGETSNDYPKPALITRKNGSVRQDTVKSAPLVALRDIEAGEELLCIYGQFSEGLGLMIK